jgi:2-polyprenyl-3-methyl-5-hydroxy-6-metoxy-1,4-benzoquinol methylase
MSSPADPDPALEALKERAWRDVAAIDRDLLEGRIDEEGWHAAMAAIIKPAYLAASDEYAQAGHTGDENTWEASRGFIAGALHRDGAFLDAGCANGILMESVHRWGAGKHLKIEPYGLDIVPEFVERARLRLPHWADRIHTGNIRTWQPTGMRFDFVMIRPEYAPAARRVDMVRHLMNKVVNPNGRVIVFVGAEEREFRRVESTIAAEFAVNGRVEIPHAKDSRLVRRLFWL